MRTSEHGEHLVQLTRWRMVNAYLVREDDGLTLVDTTVPNGEKAILRAAEQLGQPIVRIVLTHGHSDHVGSLIALAQRLPDAERLWSAREARFLRGDKSRDPDEPQTRVTNIKRLRAKANRELVGGDRVGSLEVIPAPGHSPGQIALRDTRDGTLIAGDAFSTLGGLYPSSRTNPRFPLPALATWDRPTALASARALRALDPTRLAVGHGRVLEDPGAAMDAALADADRA
jgi:glyoxylase-like metal-dependent hydrolase (beta-lactamase superfamily II)